MKQSTQPNGATPGKQFDAYEIVWLQSCSIEFLFRALLQENHFGSSEFTEDLSKLELHLHSFIEKYQDQGLF